MDTIKVRGARTHNLKNISVDIPRDKLVIITGISGSGKSSLAFNTLYAEGQRRYVESLSSYARQFLSIMEKPDVDSIEGLSPAISIEQKTTSHNPRSTVGTITEIYDYLRLLFARVGEPKCPEHGTDLKSMTVSQMVDSVMSFEQNEENEKIVILAPIVRERKGEYLKLLDDFHRQGFIRVRIDGEFFELDSSPKLSLHKKHSIDIVVDRLKIKAGIESRLAESFETALRIADGLVYILVGENKSEFVFSSKYACNICGYSLKELEPRLFSFNNPSGACPNCDGIGFKHSVDSEKIVQNKSFNLENGAIKGWDKKNSWAFHQLQSVARHYDFSLKTPFEDLPKFIQNIILFGSGNEKIQMTYISESGSHIERKQAFEGVIPNIERRYIETDSNMVREYFTRFFSNKPCPVCNGERLRIEARNVFVCGLNLPAVTNLTIGKAIEFFSDLKIDGHKGEVASRILKEVIERLKFLINVGLDYLSLNRNSETLSGGEAQRIRLASQIGAGLVGVMYVLDEPSIGLHQRDNERLLKTLMHLRDMGNSIIVIEHDEEAIRAADHVIDIGPFAGIHGGTVVAEGTYETIINNSSSLTGQYLSGKCKIEVPKKRVKFDKEKIIKLISANCNNLKNIDVEIPIGLLTCITGVSGSGKSSLINDTLFPVISKKLNRVVHVEPGSYKEITGFEHFDNIIEIDQSPIGRTPRSNPATYTGVFTPIRELFAETTEARSRGYTPGRFSFNVKGGRCEVCEGDGLIKVEMHFLADMFVTCDACQGKRYNRETLDVRYKGKNIHEVLDMTVEESLKFFSAIPVLSKKFQLLMDVGLSYIKLGQSATTLSGGEAQRIKLSKELSKRDTGKTLYILDEPTTGLHFHDIKQLLSVLTRLRDHGNTIIVIEHNLDVIKTADWIIDLGPEGGDKGGQIVVAGTPETVAKCIHSYTGQFLKKYF